MVAKLDTNDRLDKTLNYNEQKVAQETARLILVSGFLKEKEQLNFHEKMERLERNNSLNERSSVNTLHGKISFDPSERDKLTDELLAKIATRYMEGIGFKDQPYLVYVHEDTGIPHMHIVSTMITAEGKRIRDFNIGKDKSEPTREAIEKEFDLVRAKDHALQSEHRLQPVNLEKVAVGETPTKEAIQNNLLVVFNEWKVTSIAELNAVLRPLNIVADPGEPGSRMRVHHGLQYKVIDENGKTAGIPINASDFYFKPTLANLENKFVADKQNRQSELEELRTRINAVFGMRPKDLSTLVAEMIKENIELMVFRTQQGQVYGLTYVDQQQKVAVKGSDLGPEYSAKGVDERLRSENNQSLDTTRGQESKVETDPLEKTNQREIPRYDDREERTRSTPSRDRENEFSFRTTPDQSDVNFRIPTLLSDLMKTERGGEDLPKELKKDRRRQRGLEL